MANPERPRLIIHKFLSLDLCKELEFIHKSCSSVGYRPNVFSTTLSHLIATNCAHLIMPFVPLREKLKEKVEEFFECEFELFVEFTGLISWSRGASIGWHSDNDRPYLKQRDYSAVCYLNSYGKDFNGGLFHFKDGEPATIVPMAGDVVMYTADSRNVHSVDEIMEGERLTLTLWFSRDRSHDEDAKLISLLSQGQVCHSVHERYSFLPRPASSQMYWFPPDQASTHESGFDICFARIHALGCDLCPLQDKNFFAALNSSDDLSEILTEPLRMTRQDELFSGQFVNILHALQVIQFYCWKASDLQSSEQEKTVSIEPLSATQREVVNMLKHMFLKDEQLAEMHFSFRS
ncbi:Procollagen-proline 3-dioxygenase [Bertholletia excelsa]